MTWTKLGDEYSDEARDLTDAEFRTHTEALCWSNRRLLDLHVPKRDVRRFAESLEAETAAEGLAVKGWWESRGNVWYIGLRFAEWQEERAEIEQRRADWALRKRRQRRHAVGDHSLCMPDRCAHVTGDVTGDVTAGVRVGSGRGSVVAKADTSVTGSVSGSRKREPKRGSRIPDDFTVTPDMVTWAREHCPGVDGRYETEKFTDYWRAESGQRASKLDWPRAWQNWMRKAEEQAQRGNGSGRQAETDAMFGRSMARAQAREAQGELP